MQTFLVKLYEIINPVIGQPLKNFAHWVRRVVFGDSSQLGESMIVKGHVKSDWPKWFVDVGANDGVTVSNSLMFLKKGWDVILVEPNPSIFKKLTENVSAFPGAHPVQKACSAEKGKVSLTIFEEDPYGMYSRLGSGEAREQHEGPIAEVVEVEADTLTSILEQNNCPKDFGVLSVDTEGFDLAVLKSLDFSVFRPRMVITETDEDESEEQLKVDFLTECGFTVVGQTQVNSVWKRNDLL